MNEQGQLIFVVEDNDWYNKLLVHTLSLNPDHIVESFSDGKTLLKELHRKPNIITLDYRLPDANGDEILQKIHAVDPNIEVIIISEQENIETAVELLKLGAYDYLVKTPDIRDLLLNSLRNIGKANALRQRINLLEKEVTQKYEFQKTIIGDSLPIKKTFALMEKAVTNSITVTVYGETGTGKEMVAKAIHYNSKFGKEPFIAVNMAAIPRDLMESELFGHEKGAFTGAVNRRIGKFEEAKNGTLFLDEIGEMDATFQAKLLRVLQEKEVTRIGGNEVIKVNCRIIVATHRNLQDEVKAGNFREDLFFRLFGLTIELPPLRDRGKDIIILAKQFLKTFCDQNDLEQKTLSSETQKKLLSYRWPGNVRELKSVVDLAAVMANGPEITPEDISTIGGDILPDVIGEELTLREYDRRIVKLFLDKYDQNTKLVAQKLDIGQTTIYRMLKENE